MAAASSSAIGTDYPEYGSSSHKWLIALAVMLGTTLEVLDTSIVNVALPHMQGSFSASVDEIAWVLTSYLVANGIMIPMTGWISSRFGRRDGSIVAGNPDGNVSAQRATTRDGDVGDGADGRANHGPDARRMDHRQLELALEFFHQPSDRRRRISDGHDLRPRSALSAAAARERRQDRLHGNYPARDRTGRGATGARSRPARRLVQLTVDFVGRSVRRALPDRTRDQRTALSRADSGFVDSRHPGLHHVGD